MAARATGTAAVAVESKFSQLIRSGQLKSIDALAYGSFKGITGDDQCFSYKLSAFHAYGSHQAPAVSKTYNPDHYNIQHLLVNKPSPLWLSVFCAKVNGGNKKVIRTHMVRRIRTAIREALKNHDYDLSGKRISNSIGRGSKGEDLVGTMIISAKDKALTAKMDVLQDQAEMAVTALIRKFKLEREARHNSSNQNASKQNKGTPVEVKRVQMKNRAREKGGDTTVNSPKKKKNTKNKRVFAMLISLTVGKVDAGVAVLLTQDKRLIEFPSILLPPNITSGSIVDITVARNLVSEEKSQKSFVALQDSIFNSFGASEPSAPVLRCRNATQTSVVLEWDHIELATADVISLSLFRNGQKAGNIPRPSQMLSTKISGLAVDTEYTFHLVLRTSAGTFSSEKVVVKTHKMTDLSGITVTPGILPASLRDSLVKAVERIGAKMADSVRIDTTHFVTTEGRGIAWEKAVEMNIPVVRPEWVEGCERGGRIVGVRQYYLDADPKQRQIVSNAPPAQPAQAEPPREQVTTPTTSPPPTNTNGTNGQTVPPTPPAKDTPKPEKEEREKEQEDGDASSDSGEGQEKQETEKTAVSEEQKSRASDVEQQKLALRPAAPFGVSADDLTKPGEENASGNQTPGNASFQDVAL
ncbi:putative brca1 c terminus domain-containing protein [Botrytis cinerea BcDW1]|nr:putative brca1 c terminus domain-containing protein [Botrytis cinerea BcDW1]